MSGRNKETVIYYFNQLGGTALNGGHHFCHLLIDEKRAKEVFAFYIDLERSISSIAQVLSPHATICYVIGNRRVKGVMLPTDDFVVETFRQHGFVHKEAIARNIPNKRMPKKNSPTNIAGKTSTTMHEENIVVCQRTTHIC